MSLVTRIPQVPGCRAASWRAKEFIERLKPSSSEERDNHRDQKREATPTSVFL